MLPGLAIKQRPSSDIQWGCSHTFLPGIRYVICDMNGKTTLHGLGTGMVVH